MKKILIGGGSGLLGSALSKHLSNQNFEVSVLSRSPNKVRGFQSIYWDPVLMELDMNSIPAVDAIINLSGAGIADKRWTKNRKEELWASRVRSNALLMKVIEELSMDVRVFIGASAVGYYGDRGEEKITESSGAGAPGFLVDLCKAWEVSIEKIRETGLRTITLRMGVVLTHKGGFLNKMLLPRRFGLVPYFGRGHQFLSWVHVEDICRIFHFLLENDQAGDIYNGVSPDPVSFKDFAKELVNCHRHVSIALGIPARLVKLFFGQLSEAILMGNKVFPVRLQEQGFSFKYDNIERALQDLQGPLRGY